MNPDSIFKIFSPRNICFAEQDGAEPAGGSGASEPELILDDAASGEPEADDDLAELEIGPDKYKVPKPIKEGWNGLQKTVQTEKEALKARAAELDAREARSAENEKLRSAFADEVAEIRGIDKQLEPYLKLTPQDWMAWAEQDQAAANKAQVAINALNIQRQKLVGTAQAKAQELDSKQRQAVADRMAQAEKELPAKIQGWSPEKKAALIKVANENGFSEAELGPVVADWRVMSILDKAAKYDAAVARAAKVKADAAKAAKDGIPEPEPAPKVRSNTSSTSSVPRDSDDAATWLKKRNAQLARRNGR